MADEIHTSTYFDREKLQFVGLESLVMKQLKKTYPGVDVETELKKMILWLLTPKGARRKGNMGFIINWLNKAPKSQFLSVEDDKVDSPLRPLIDEYNKDLWKRNNAEAILAMNKRQA